MSATVEFGGGFGSAFATGDNAPILPTGTMTNTVLALAPDHTDRPPELFASALALHFLTACPTAHTVGVRLTGRPWAHLAPGGEVDPTGFAPAGEERWTVGSVHSRTGEPTLTGGIDGLRLAKTTGAGFTGFLRDEFTSTPDFPDRLMGAVFTLDWYYRAEADTASLRDRARAGALAAFTAHTSLSGQQTLHVLGAAVLAACPEVDRIDLRCEANDHLLADLTPFGRANPRQVYTAPRNPYSVVHLTLARGDGTSPDPHLARTAP